MNKRRTRTSLGSTEEDILRHLTAGDLLMSFLLSSRSSRAFYREAYKRARIRYQYKRSIEGLEKKGVVAHRGDTIFLTEKGKELAEILASRSAPIAASWKGRWWIAAYDIPVSMNPYRFELRRILIRAGFRKLQHSVWMYPHQCKELELFLKNNPSIRTFVRYFQAQPFAGLETIEDWKRLDRS